MHCKITTGPRSLGFALCTINYEANYYQTIGLSITIRYLYRCIGFTHRILIIRILIIVECTNNRLSKSDESTIATVSNAYLCTQTLQTSSG